MKNIIAKTLLAGAAAVFSIGASAAINPQFDVNTVVKGINYSFTADSIGGSYKELIDLTSLGNFTVSLVWTATSFEKDGDTLGGDVTGVNSAYGLYALYNASGTVSTDGTATIFTFQPGSGTLSLWLDTDKDSKFTADAGNTQYTASGNDTDILLGSGVALSGLGRLDPALTTCGTGGNNCGSFGSKTAFDLLAAGKDFFVKPAPFYELSLQGGNIKNFTPTGHQPVFGQLQVAFAVPKPTSVALLGLGLIGLTLSRRRSKKV